ncbi:beta/gamma crystallin-related protein [Couchioplanes caeruleus]|uniref:Beta/gamma crystallin 'Greek key' domain-containing protein n=2 Tax=Couchioplanes caeruleus TaxID=56438 RepID=A0A1K0GHH5_9ACTN|nr:beta/gamma crystallin-related protein [Couchioplanes caeruleus]OJF11694.1 hypothetical protein BG844_24780 [Couchioplanes caeruleus subsp. caeruleus]ROP33006.1 beta/gamma crystallin [Couchioplanes caeruleus]
MRTILAKTTLILAGTAALIGLGATGASAAPTAQAAVADSPLTLGEHQSLSGSTWDYRSTNRAINPEDEASSAYNHSSVAWVLYQHDNFEGRRYCLKPGQRISNLHDSRWDFGDKISSVQRLGVTSCNGYPTF